MLSIFCSICQFLKVGPFPHEIEVQFGLLEYRDYFVQIRRHLFIYIYSVYITILSVARGTW
jgi:hypothetical protein